MTERKRLTVTELWELLATLPPDAEVWVDDSNRRFCAPITGAFAFPGNVDGRVYLFPGE